MMLRKRGLMAIVVGLFVAVAGAAERTILINFATGKGTGTTAWGTWNETSGGSGSKNNLVFTDGSSGAGTVVWSSFGVYQSTITPTESFLKGYLDDCWQNGQVEPEITITTPFETCDVTIYCATDQNGNKKFSYKQVNGVNYTFRDGLVVKGTADWGNTATTSPTEGANALTVRGCAGSTIRIVSGQATSNDNRGSIAAIKIVESVVKTVCLSEDTTWSQIVAEAGSCSVLRLTIAEGAEPTVVFDTANNSLSETKLIVGGPLKVKAADSLFETGCFGKKLLTAAVVIEDGASLVAAALKEGYKGAYQVQPDGIALYAQNGEVISVNIGGGQGTGDAPAANLISGNDYYGLYPVPGTAWTNFAEMWQSVRSVTIDGTSAYDGATLIPRNTLSLNCTAKNTWSTSANVPFLRGYLDDGTGISVSITGIPYSSYDVIVYAMSDSAARLAPFVINGASYTCGEDGVAVPGETAWGQGQYLDPQFGKNAMLIPNQTGGTLTVTGVRTTGDNDGRATLAAVQILQRGEIAASEFSAKITASTLWNGGAGEGLSERQGAFVNSDRTLVVLTNTAENATLTLDDGTTAARFKFVVENGATLHLAKAEGATLDIGEYDLTECGDKVVFDFDPDFSKVNAGDGYFGVGYTVDDVTNQAHLMGADNTIAGRNFGQDVGAMKFKLGGTGTVTDTFDVFNNSQITVTGDYTVGNRLACTYGTLTIAEGARVTAPSIMTSNDGSAVNARINIDGEVWITSDSDSNVYNSRNNYVGILLGHWQYGNGTKTYLNIGETGSLVGSNCWLQASFGRPSEIVVDGGLLQVKGINGGANDIVSSLTLRNGATLALKNGVINGGYLPISCAVATIKAFDHEWVNVSATAFTDAATGTTIDPCGFTITQSGALSGAGRIRVADSSGTGGSFVITGSTAAFTGTIEVAAGSTLDIGVVRPPAIELASGSTLRLQLTSKTEIPTFACANGVDADSVTIVLSDVNGTDVIAGASLVYDEASQTFTVCSGKNIWSTTETAGSFENETLWSKRTVPADGSEFAVMVDGDTTITVNADHTASAFTVSGSGLATFTGTGRLTNTGVTYITDDARVAFGENYAVYGEMRGNGTLVVKNNVLMGDGNVGGLWRKYYVAKTVVEAGGTLTLGMRDTYGGNVVSEAGYSLTVNAGGKVKSNTFNSLPKVYLNGGTIEATGSLGSGAWRSVHYAQGLVVGGETTSFLTASAANAVAHQLGNPSIEVQAQSRLVVDAPLRNGTDGNGNQGNYANLVKTGTGTLEVNVAPEYTGTTTINGGVLEMNAVQTTGGEYVVADGAALRGTGSLTAAVKLNGGSACVAGGLTLGTLKVTDGVRIGRAWNPMSGVRITTAINNFSARAATVTVGNGAVILDPAVRVADTVTLNVAKFGNETGVESNGVLVAGAGDTAVSLDFALTKDAVSEGEKRPCLAVEVKRDGAVRTTGWFEISAERYPDGFDLSGWAVGSFAKEAGVRAPSTVKVAHCATGFRNLAAADAVSPDGKKVKLVLSDDGQTLFLQSNQLLIISVR